MAEVEPVRVPERPPSMSWRLAFRYDRAGVWLSRRLLIDMIAPQSPGPPPSAKEHSGAWIAVRNRRGGALSHRLLHDPFALRAEHHSPDGQIEVVERELEEGEFEVVVPAFPDASDVALYSSPLAPGRYAEPAQEVGRFRLDQEEDIGTGEQQPWPDSFLGSAEERGEAS